MVLSSLEIMKKKKFVVLQKVASQRDFERVQ